MSKIRAATKKTKETREQPHGRIAFNPDIENNLSAHPLTTYKPNKGLGTESFILLAEEDKKLTKKRQGKIELADIVITNLGILLPIINEVLNAYKPSHSFSPMTLHYIQLLNSSLPFVVVNMANILNGFHHVNNSQKLMLKYQHSHKINDKNFMLYHYQLLIKIGIRIAFSDNLPLIKRVEPQLIDYFIRQHFKEKSLTELNQQIERKLDFLDKNPISANRYFIMYTIAVIAIIAIICVSLDVKLFKNKNTEAITMLAIASCAAAIMLESYFFNHSTVLAPAIKKALESGLEYLTEGDKKLKQITNWMHDELSTEESDFLKKKYHELKNNEVATLLHDDVTQENTTLLAQDPQRPQHAKWSFFVHHSLIVNEADQSKAKKAYDDVLNQLKSTFDNIIKELQKENESNTTSKLKYQEETTVLLNPTLNLENQLNEIKNALKKISKKSPKIKNKVLEFNDNSDKLANARLAYESVKDDAAKIRAQL